MDQGFFSRIKNLHLISPKLVEGIFAGNYRSVFKGTGIEFDEVRNYVEGDDIRLIDWNVTSRMGTPYAKNYREERELVMFLLIDVSASMLSGSGAYSKGDMASMLAALLSYAAHYNDDQVGAAFFSDHIERWVPPRKGRTHVNSLIQDMVKMRPEGTTTKLGPAIRTVYETMKRRGICVIISDFRTEEGWRELSILSRKHDVIAIRVYDPSDREFPRTGLIELQDPETGHRVLAMGRNKTFVREYRDFWDAQRVYWQRECARRGIDTLAVATSQDPGEALLRFFNRRGKVMR